MRFTRKNVGSTSPPRPSDAAVAEVRRIEAELAEVAERASASSVPRHSGRLLGTLLVTRGYLVQAELDYVLKRQTETGQRIGAVLLDLDLVDEQALIELVAEQLRLEVFDESRVPVNPRAARRLAEAEARGLHAVPIHDSASWVAVAVADPTQPDLVAQLVRRLGLPVRLYVATRATIADLTDRIYRTDAIR